MICGGLALVAAIATAAVASPAQAGARGGDGAATTACITVNHSKRVTVRVKVRKKGKLVRRRGKPVRRRGKLVRRKGKLVRVKRRRTVRWTTCAAAMPAPAPQPPAPSPAGCPVPASALGVSARDDAPGPRYSLSRACVTAGSVSVELNNQGEDPHNLLLRPADAVDPTPTHRIPDEEPFELGPLSQQDDSFNLAPGRWYLWCDLQSGQHELAGMHATLEVR